MKALSFALRNVDEELIPTRESPKPRRNHVHLAGSGNLTPVACCTPVADPNITRDQAETLASIFKALADPHRVRIVNLLANAAEPVCVCEFMPQLGLSQGAVSFHLKKVLAVGLLDRKERGTWAYYSLKREGLGRLATFFDAREVAT